VVPRYRIRTVRKASAEGFPSGSITIHAEFPSERRVFRGMQHRRAPGWIVCRLEHRECGEPSKPRLESAGSFHSVLGVL
jgi:hypothetical protein